MKIAFQMDPIEDVDIDADSTFRLAEEAQSRGHDLYVYNPDSLIFNQAKNIAELFDGVKITQGKSTLNAEYVKVIYSKTDNNLEEILAERNVELKSNTDIAKADKAVYSLIENSISLTGNAQLVQGSNKILADQILIDTKTGLTQLLGGVKTVILPSTN